MITVVGGSFTRFHKGHREMLKTAVDTGNHVIVGLTTDEFLRKHKAYDAPPYHLRRRRIVNYLQNIGGDFEVKPLETKGGNADTSPDYEAIVVSQETVKQAVAINEARMKRGLRPLRIITVPIVLAEDLFPISSSRIVQGEIRPSGRRIVPVKIAVSTGNPLKVEAVEKFLWKLMKNFQVTRNQNYVTETQQPLGVDTQINAVKRAMAALGSGDYGIGIESGLYRDPVTSLIMDIHYCAVVDRYSRITVGTGSGFQIPDPIVSGVKSGLTESEAYIKYFDGEDPGASTGIVGVISSDKVTRLNLIYEAVRNAFIPRIAPGFYGFDQKL